MDAPILFSLVLSILSLLASIYVLKLQQTSEEERRPRKEVAVCVLSARDHFAQRMTLRDTWVGGIQSNPDLNQRMKVWFVVGSKDCDIAPEDRMDAHDCVPRPLPSTDFSENADLAAFSLLETKDNIPLQMASTRIAVQVLESMFLKRIGIPEFLPVENGFTVTLLLANQSEVVHDSADFLHVKFSPMDPGILHHGYRYQPVVPVFLQRDTELELVLSCDGGDILAACDVTSLLTSSVSHRTTEASSGILHIQTLLGDRTLRHPSSTSLSLVNFMVALSEPVDLQRQIRAREERAQEWASKREETELRLQAELRHFDDVILVNVTDVYRSLPRKLLACHQWLWKRWTVDWVLKTDDDCFVDAQKLVSSLDSAVLPNNSYWGSFRENWLVERHGKWRERFYTADVYPKFACGSGYVVGKHLHKWLAANDENLHSFQGEDVAMGIWLSAVAPVYHQDSRWRCTQECKGEVLALPELTPEMLHLHWAQLQQCGDPCKAC